MTPDHKAAISAALGDVCVQAMERLLSHDEAWRRTYADWTEVKTVDGHVLGIKVEWLRFEGPDTL